MDLAIKVGIIDVRKIKENQMHNTQFLVSINAFIKLYFANISQKHPENKVCLKYLGSVFSFSKIKDN